MAANELIALNELADGGNDDDVVIANDEVRL